ncbi:tetratricopeptide repeat protein [Neobacillus piezotolerans]|uniref:Tetratricopeptide repeat protein n=1 Tax=Neobacillus piezotolerans TaxID=2259171 RepID=A0A3D8GPC9_9BACI|nr:tetratricopeptide repeat protein [Neobacillus piezotolerans]RDU36278.1 tetratricopeptide repeat protein [Neobacillus piezotolerans]
MKKKGRENIVFFPDVERRLAEKGIEALHEKRFNEAICLLEQGRELDPSNSDITAALVLAYFEAGALRKAKELCKEMLMEGTGDYFQLVEMYITILIQLHEYREITEVLEALFDEREVPAEKREHFLTILQFCKRLADNDPIPAQDSELEDIEEHSIEEQIRPGEVDFLKINDLKQQVQIAGRLAGQNIQPFIPEIATFLNDEKGHPFFKTILLNLLREQNIDSDLVIRKFGVAEKVNPVFMPALHELHQEHETGRILSEELEHRDPVLLENVLSLVQRYFFASYPFELEPGNPSAWAAAFHIIAMSYLGSPPDLQGMARMYKVKKEEVDKAIDWIRKVEEISYPII